MTKQVKNFNKTRLPIGTLTNFHKKVLTLIGTTTAAALHVEGLEPQYAAAVETLSSIVNRPTTYVASSTARRPMWQPSRARMSTTVATGLSG